MNCSNCGNQIDVNMNNKCPVCGIQQDNLNLEKNQVYELIENDINESNDKILSEILKTDKIKKSINKPNYNTSVSSKAGKISNNKSKYIAAVISSLILLALLAIVVVVIEYNKPVDIYSDGNVYYDQDYYETDRTTEYQQSYSYTSESLVETTIQSTVFSSTEDTLPAELRQYRNGLVEENRYYKIMLEESDWNILFRSAPIVTDSDDANDNRICKIGDGEIIYVKYIYNGLWAVYEYNGQWGFSAIFAGAKAGGARLMYPTE